MFYLAFVYVAGWFATQLVGRYVYIRLGIEVGNGYYGNLFYFVIEIILENLDSHIDSVRPLERFL